MIALMKKFLHNRNIHPRRWFYGFLSYPRYLGYIKPHLLTGGEQEFFARRACLRHAWQPRFLVSPVGKRILVISPHPDDESVGAGGFLLAHRDVAEIHCIILSDGTKGGALERSEYGNVSAAALGAERRQEFSRAADVLHCKTYHYLDFPDGDIPCTIEAARALGSLVDTIKPDVVLLPWFLDEHSDHRRANVLYAWGCAKLEVTVLAYEVWTMLEPNALFDISEYLESKRALIENYKSQLATIDYCSYVTGLSLVRAFQYSVSNRRNGALEAYLALPNREYCEIVSSLYGTEGVIKKESYPLLGMECR